MKYKTENPIEEVTPIGTVVEIKVEEDPVEETESKDTSVDVTEITKLLSEVIVTASDLISKLNKVNGK